MKYAITVNGKRHLFDSLESATRCASDIFNKTGIIVGIEVA